MDGAVHGVPADRDPQTGRFKRGNNARDARLIKILAKAEELRREYFPCGGESVMDGNRLRLAARHYVVAESVRDPVVSQRSIRVAEYLLSKIRREEAPLPLLDDLLETAK